MIEELKNIILFLEENEQYGDDWSKEIAVLQKLLKLKAVFDVLKGN